jgi:peptide/nickel transport system substrate-binding protein
MKRLLLILAIMLAGSAMLTACSAAAPAAPPETAASDAAETTSEEAAPAEAAAEGSTLRIALSTFPNSLDIPITAERNASNAAWQMYNSLVWTDDDGAVVPALAESWEISEDGTEITMKLREDVTFHNGEPFNADTVIFSWERGQQPDMQWSDRWALVSEIEKVDDYTVILKTEEPNPLLLRIMTEDWAMVPPQYINEVGEDGFAAHPVGTGPFEFVEWAKGDRIVMKAFADYWEEEYPKVDNLVFRPIPESSTRLAAVKTGEIDIVGRLSAEEAAQLEGMEGVEVISYPVDRVYYIAFNNLTTGVGLPTEDPKVRQAMNYAVDVDAIIDALFAGNGRPSTGYVTPANWGYDTEIQPFGYDPDKARELLADAGYADGFEIDFACPSGAYTNFEQVCEAIVGYLGDVGITTNLEMMESGQYWDLESKKELPPLFGDSWSATVGEAYPRLTGALGGWDASFSAWSDPEIDRLLGEIGKEMDDNARADLYVELQRYMQENPPFIYLYEPVTFEAKSTRVKDYRPRPAENYYLKYTSVEE